MNKLLRMILPILVITSFAAKSHAESIIPLLADQVKERAIHSIDSNIETDEAYKAMHLAQPTMDNAQLEKLKAGSSEDYYHDMDYGITNPQNQASLQKELSRYLPNLSKEDAVSHLARGRNNWIVWTAGNDKFWNDMDPFTLGGLDFLKTISSYKGDPRFTATLRSERWQKLGIVNEPCFVEPDGPDQAKFGLWLDQRTGTSGDCAKADPFADEKKYPGIKIGSRGTYLIDKKNGNKKILFPVGSFYGYPTGVVGLRLFPNPEFNQEAFDKWDPEAYYTDPSYYSRPDIVRPYRVGMACAFCHVGPNPSLPPKDFNNPEWANLNSNTGAQYYWFNRIFFWDYKNSKDNFLFQMVSTYRPGALDTSLMSSDQINNPRTMNAVYNLPARVILAHKMNAREALTGNEQLNKQFSNIGLPKNSMLTGNAEAAPRPSWVESLRVLKDGSDSVGALGALNRVFINIGLFSEEWVMDFIPLIGGRKIIPFRIDLAEKNSLYWQATEAQTPDLALFFLAATRPDKLANDPNPIPAADPVRGGKVFARNCAQCHSSKLPEKAYSFFKQPDPNACVGENYMKCWDAYWHYAKSDEFKNSMISLMDSEGPNFLTFGKPGTSGYDPTQSNYLSTELRVPANMTDSNLCSPLATNAIAGNIWDNFSSTSYKKLPTIGSFTVAEVGMSNGVLNTHPKEMPVPGYDAKEKVSGGRGYVRPPSLASLWSSAPFLVNNSLGKFRWEGTTEARLDSFNDSIHKLLHPNERGSSGTPGEQEVKFKTNYGDQITGVVDVTTEDAYIKIPKGDLPNLINATIEVYNKVRHPFRASGYQTRSKVDVAAIDKILKSRKSGRKVAQALDGDLTAAEDKSYVGEDSQAMYKLGPIPKGVPINLISNIDLRAPRLELIYAIYSLLDGMNAKGGAQKFMDIAATPLLKVSKCNDFVVNRGHYFGTEYYHTEKDGLNTTPRKRTDDLDVLSEDEKNDLIEYLKTL